MVLLLIIIPGRNYIDESIELAKKIGAEVLNVKYKVFPDGEKYVRIENSEKIMGKPVIISNTMYPSQNDSFIETLMLINASIKANASRIVAYIPYLAYSRQDKVFLTGEPVSAEIVLKTLYYTGIDCLITIDIHSEQVLKELNKCFYNIQVFDILFNNVKHLVNDPIVIAPDKGALNRAKYLADKFSLQYDYLVKERDRVTGEITIQTREIDIRNRDIVIVDDIISTGGTIAEASRKLIEKGARRVIVCASHGLLIGNAIENIKKAGVLKIVLANTLGIRFQDPFIEYVDVSERIAKILLEVLK